MTSTDEVRKYRVYLETVASTVIVVKIDDPSLSEDEAKYEAVNIAYEYTPDVCAHCAGWGQPAGIELGEWGESGPPDPAEEDEEPVN